MPSKPNILVVGPSGSGKSNSLEQLFAKHGKDVAFLDFERKGMPFLYDHTKLGFYREISTYAEALTALSELKDPKTGVSKYPIVVHDSLTKFTEYARAAMMLKHTGWDIWNGYNTCIRNFMEFNKSLNCLWIVLGIDEVVWIEQAQGTRVSRVRCFVQGKELEGKIEKEFLVVLYSTTLISKEGKVSFVFKPHTDGITAAKSPQWLKLDTVMPNDLSLVVDKMKEAKLL